LHLLIALLIITKLNIKNQMKQIIKFMHKVQD